MEVTYELNYAGVQMTLNRKKKKANQEETYHLYMLTFITFLAAAHLSHLVSAL
jgi:hypothetical protein